MNRKPISTYKPAENYKTKFNDLVSEPSENNNKICCPSCDNEISASDINLSDKIAKCGGCNSVFSIAKDIANLTDVGSKNEIKKPAGIDVFRHDDNLEIILNQPIIMMEAMSALLLPILTIIGTVLYFQEGISILIPAVFLFSFLYTLYNLIWRERHKIFINVDHEHLNMFWEPNKLKKDVKIRIEDIEQVYIKKVNVGATIFVVVDSPEGQKHVALISDLTSLSVGRYISQEIERHLNISE